MFFQHKKRAFLAGESLGQINTHVLREIWVVKWRRKAEMWGLGCCFYFYSLCRPGEGHWQLGMSQNQPCTVCWWKLFGETLLNPISRHTKPKAEAAHHKSYVQIKRQWREGTWGSKSRSTVRNGWISWVSEPGSLGSCCEGRLGTSFRSILSCPGTQQSAVCDQTCQDMLQGWLFFFSLTCILWL